MSPTPNERLPGFVTLAATIKRHRRHPAGVSGQDAAPRASRRQSPCRGSPAEQPPQDGSTAETSNEEVKAAALIGLSAAAAAALWGGLLAARRRHHRGRRPGRQAPTVDLAAVRTEKRLRERANDVDVAWLDLALRSLGTVLSGHPGPVPDITAAYLGPRGLRLQLAAEQPAPDPFVTDGTTWWLPAAADLPITAAGAVDQMTPLPTLTSIGTLGAETVLVDLERLGSVGLQGDQDACRALITHMAVELAHQSWSDGVTVTLVGWGQGDGDAQPRPADLFRFGSRHLTDPGIPRPGGVRRPGRVGHRHRVGTRTGHRG